MGSVTGWPQLANRLRPPDQAKPSSPTFAWFHLPYCLPRQLTTAMVATAGRLSFLGAGKPLLAGKLFDDRGNPMSPTPEASGLAGCSGLANQAAEFFELAVEVFDQMAPFVHLEVAIDRVLSIRSRRNDGDGAAAVELGAQPIVVEGFVGERGADGDAGDQRFSNWVQPSGKTMPVSPRFPEPGFTQERRRTRRAPFAGTVSCSSSGRQRQTRTPARQ